MTRQLIEAVDGGRIEEAERLLADGADPNFPYRDGQTVLHAALMHAAFIKAALMDDPLPDQSLIDYNRLIPKLLAAGADPNAPDNEGETPLHWAAEGGDAQKVKALLAAGGDPNKAEHGVRVVPERNLPEGARQANRTGAPLGYTAMHKAANAEVVELLLAHGGDPDRPGQHGRRPLFAALRDGRDTVGHVLLDAGADPNGLGPEFHTPLHQAKSPAMTERLLNLGVDPHALSNNGDAPVHIITGPEEPEAGKFDALLDAGANLDLANNYGETPLHQAAQAGHVGAARVMIDAGCALDARMSGDRTPLHMSESAEVTRALLDAGADADARDDMGMTPLHKAEEPDQAQALIAAGADLDAEDHRGETPLQIQQSDNPAVAEVIKTELARRSARGNAQTRRRSGSPARGRNGGIDEPTL